MPDEDVTLDYVIDNLVIRGTVNHVVDQILAMREKIGDFGTLLYCGKDWTDPALEPPLDGIDGREGDAGGQCRDRPAGGGGVIRHADQHANLLRPRPVRLSRSAGRPARAGMLILTTIFGINEFARGYADMLAENGITAAVWDINSGLPLTTDYQECISRARTLTDTGVAAMLDKWLTFMRGDLNLTSIGTAGFCIGGRFALLLCAKDKRIKACVAAYPSIENPRLANQELDAVALSAQIECPVHIVQPGKDHVSSVETYDSAQRHPAQAQPRRPSCNIIRSPSTASCIALSRRRTRRPPRWPRRRCWRSSRLA